MDHWTCCSSRASCHTSRRPGSHRRAAPSSVAWHHFPALSSSISVVPECRTGDHRSSRLNSGCTTYVRFWTRSGQSGRLCLGYLRASDVLAVRCHVSRTHIGADLVRLLCEAQLGTRLSGRLEQRAMATLPRKYRTQLGHTTRNQYRNVGAEPCQRSECRRTPRFLFSHSGEPRSSRRDHEDE